MERRTTTIPCRLEQQLNAKTRSCGAGARARARTTLRRCLRSAAVPQPFRSRSAARPPALPPQHVHLPCRRSTSTCPAAAGSSEGAFRDRVAPLKGPLANTRRGIIALADHWRPAARFQAAASSCSRNCPVFWPPRNDRDRPVRACPRPQPRLGARRASRRSR